MSFLNVDESKCTKCGICVELCPAEIVRFGDLGLPEVGPASAGACIQCGQCVLYCPTCANTLAFQNEDELVRTSELPLPEKTAALNLLKSRRSVRRYKKEPLKKEEIAQLLETVKTGAPTAVNSQKVRWIATQTEEKTKEALNLVLCWFREEIFKDPTGRIGLIGARMIAVVKRAATPCCAARPT